jgi:acyl-CoA reductase-like NAD-dependent aldehyde dehydrogenase
MSTLGTPRHHPPLTRSWGANRPEPLPDSAEREPIPALVSASRRAQALWAATPVRDRLRAIRRLRHAIAGHALELAESTGRAAVRNVAEALVAEVLPLADACRFLERRAESLLRPRRLGWGGRPAWLWGSRASIRRVPFGVVLVIGPSNYPLMLPGVQALQALAAGNSVLWKPGRGGEDASLALAVLAAGAGIDPALLVVLPESVDAAREAIAEGVDRVVMTGSADVGRAVLAELAPRLVPATLELSGCDAAFLLEGADLDLFARALAFALRFNGGATCIAPHRAFVPRHLATDLGRRLAGAIESGPSRRLGPEEGRRIGPLVRDALDRGARLIAGHARAGDDLVAPLVLAGVDPDARLLQEDPFGPVLALVSVADEDEALRLAEKCPYALGVSIFGNPRRARVLAAKIPAGVVQINDLIVPTADPRLSFGGRGGSGFGRTRGAEGLLEMTATQVVVARGGRSRPHYEPLADDDAAIVHRYLKAAHSSSLAGRVVNAVGLCRDLARKTRGRRET